MTESAADKIERAMVMTAEICEAVADQNPSLAVALTRKQRTYLASIIPDPVAAPGSAEPVAERLARRCLWIAYCWNSHNFHEAYTYARKEAQDCGINSFDEANDWIARPVAAPQDWERRGCKGGKRIGGAP